MKPDPINLRRLAAAYGILLSIHLLLPLRWSDDAVFLEKAARMTLSAFLKGSARPVIDAATWFFALHPIVWRVLNPCVLLLLFFLLVKYLHCEKEKKLCLFLGASLLYPSMVLVDAGFMATTLNYLWPVTFGLLALLPAWKRLHGQKTRLVEMLLLLPCLIYAVHMQQMCAVLTVLFFGCLLVKKGFHPYILLQSVFSAGFLLYSYHLNTAGENARIARETARHFPDFPALNLLQKVELGFSSTAHGLTMEIHFAWVFFFFFVCLIAVLIAKVGCRAPIRAVSLLAAFFPLLFAVQSVLPEKLRLLAPLVPGCLKNYRMGKAVYDFSPGADVFFLLLLGCLLFLLSRLIRQKAARGCALVLLAIGFGSRMIMGFSPTVWASGYRTYCILFLCLIAVSVLAWKGAAEQRQPQPQQPDAPVKD